MLSEAIIDITYFMERVAETARILHRGPEDPGSNGALILEMSVRRCSVRNDNVMRSDHDIIELLIGDRNP